MKDHRALLSLLRGLRMRLRAGSPLGEALRDAGPAAAEARRLLEAGEPAGRALSRGLAPHDRVLAAELGAVDAGASLQGSLALAADRLVLELRATRAMRAALSYPLVLAGAAAVLATGWLAALPLLGETGERATPTLGGALTAVAVAAWVGLVAALLGPRLLGARLDELSSRVPLLRRLTHRPAQARFALRAAAILRSGASARDAIAGAAAACRHRQLGRQLERALARVDAGGSPAEAFAASGLRGPVVAALACDDLAGALAAVGERLAEPGVDRSLALFAVELLALVLGAGMVGRLVALLAVLQ